jgi:hypothetical protein
MMELHIENRYSQFVVEFWLSDSCGDKRCHYHWNGENIIEQTVDVASYTNELKPFLSLPAHFAGTFLRLIADHANRTGVRTEHRDFIEGELQATKKHLEDLQKAFNALIAK